MRRIWAWLGSIVLLCGGLGVARANDPESPLPYSADNHFVIDSGIYGLRPQFNNNAAFYTTRNAVGPLGVLNPLDTTVNRFSHSLELVPQVHLGYVDMTGLGVHSRYWSFDQHTATGFITSQSADPATAIAITTAAPLGLSYTAIAITPLPDNFNISSYQRMHVVDVEGAQEIEFGPWLVTLGGGIRYVNLQQGYDAVRNRSGSYIDPVTTDFVQVFADSTTLVSRTEFNGIGPLINLESRRRLGNSPVSLFGLARGTVLFGNTTQTVNMNIAQSTLRQLAIGGTTTESPGGDINRTQTATNSTNNILPTMEVEAGLEYDYILGGVRLFCQSAFVGQAWLGGGNGSGSNAGTAGTGAVTNSNFGFLGFSLRAGLMF